MLEEGLSSTRRVLYAAMVANVAIVVAKMVAAAVTGSSAMLSEGIHSVVDTGNGGLLLLGLQLSRRPADELHPFGYGRELYFWTMVVALAVFALGGGVSIYEGIAHLFHPHPLEHGEGKLYRARLLRSFRRIVAGDCSPRVPQSQPKLTLDPGDPPQQGSSILHRAV